LESLDTYLTGQPDVLLTPALRAKILASDDSDFEREAADVIGLYLGPP